MINLFLICQISCEHVKMITKKNYTFAPSIRYSTNIALMISQLLGLKGMITFLYQKYQQEMLIICLIAQYVTSINRFKSFIIFGMRQIFAVLLVLSLLLTIGDCRRKKEKLEQKVETKQERKTVVEANHFYSNTETNTTYDIDGIEKDKSLVFFLKPEQGKQDDKTLSDNPIAITLDGGSDKASCVFDSYEKMCSLSKVSVETMKLKIQCKKTPCELSWEIIQPAVSEQDGTYDVDRLVAVNSKSNHGILKVSCNNPELKDTFADEIQLYTNSQYKRVPTKMGTVYFLFGNEDKGYYYIFSKSDKAKACANATLTHADEEVKFDEKDTHFDFISTQFSNSYEFKTIPSTDFRMDVSAHDIAFQKLENTTGIKLILLGYKDGTNKVVSNFTLLVDDEKDYIDFSAVFKKVTEKYDKLQMEIHGFGNTLIVQSKFIANDVQEIEFGEQSYFTLAKGEKIKYHLVPLVMDNSNTDIKKMYIFVDPAKLFKVNETSCETKGCFFEVQAIENGTGWIYIGESQTKNTKQIIVVPFDKSITKKIREGQQLYYSYKMKADHAIQLLINTPNVLAYASSKSKCEVVDEQKCYEKIFTYHNPSIYEPVKEDTLLIKVIALDNAEFTITVIDQQSKYVQLKDTVPFTYLLDDSQKSLNFYFKLADKQDVSFNLIGPANQLDLLVSNQEKAAKQAVKDVDWATDGFIKFEKKELTGKNFFIVVRKKETFAKNWVHFTIIASTKQSNMRLQPGVAHYENLQPKDTKDFVFEFIPKKRILLNFYTHNIKQSVNINMKVSNTDDYNNDETTADFTIDSQVDSLDLGLVSKKLCEKEDENCELFVRLQNKMQIDADITITLLISDSVIELKDGIWQNYDINSISSSSHFYYIPNHANHSTTIFYKSSLPDLKIMYNLWKTDDKSMDPSTWPFPTEFKENEKISELTFKPLHFIHVEPNRLKQCWPNCVLLLSIAPDFNNAKKSITNDTKFTLLDQDFKIMASNSFIQLPQKHKLDIPLTKGQSKEILIDLKYHLDKEAITLYVYYTLGVVNMKANVYTDKKPRCPTTEDEADFKLTGREQNIPIEQIKAKLSQNSMESEDNTPYLCILATALSDAKITVEFTSDKSSTKELAIDTSTPLSPRSGDKNLFLIYLDQDVYVKITRQEGFPFFISKRCQPAKNGDTSKCVQQFEGSDEKGIQLADKVTEFEGKPCDKCLLLFKITSDQPSKFVIHTQSKYAELQLAENNPLSDSLNPNQENRYTLTAAKNEEIIINVQIISGNLKVDVHDFEKIFIAKNNSAGSKNIHIVIPPKDAVKEKKQLGSTYMTSFSLSSFVHLHLIITSQNPKDPAIYTITYSSGEAITYLQDGLISQYSLASKKPTKFMYLNPTITPIYLHATTSDATQLNKLDVKIFALDDPQDEDSIVSMTPEKPDFKKKTPNPTLLMLLPAKKAYLFQVTNNNDKDVLYTLGINNREIIYLPFDHEFPLHLAKTQFIYVVLNTHAAGYVKLSISKCDESYPFIGYTLDYNEFVNEDFQVEEQMTDELSQDLVIKVKEAGGLYFKIRSPDDDTTLMSLKATFSPNKIVPNRSKPGDKGLVQYQLLDSTKAELTFTALVCTGNDKNCGKDFTYTSLSSDKIEQVYAQLACPSIMFDLPDAQVLKSAQVATIPSTNAKGSKITFTQTIKGEIQYVGVKAVNSKTGEVVYYQPVEIVTFWGQVHRTTGTTIILGAIILFFFLCGGLVIYRRAKKSKEYSSLGDVNDEL